MTEHDYPSWMTENLKRCPNNHPVILHYDEHQNYHVECSKCRKQLKFKTSSSNKAKHIWNLFALIRYKHPDKHIYLCINAFELPNFDEQMKLTEQYHTIPKNSIWVSANEVGESDLRLHKIAGAVQTINFIDITKDTLNRHFNAFE